MPTFATVITIAVAAPVTDDKLIPLIDAFGAIGVESDTRFSVVDHVDADDEGDATVTVVAAVLNAAPAGAIVVATDATVM